LMTTAIPRGRERSSSTKITVPVSLGMSVPVVMAGAGQVGAWWRWVTLAVPDRLVACHANDVSLVPPAPAWPPSTGFVLRRCLRIPPEHAHGSQGVPSAWLPFDIGTLALDVREGAQIRYPSAQASGTERSLRYGQPDVSRSKRYLRVICARAQIWPHLSTRRGEGPAAARR
jgi:hypothetical protein